jgi:D-lactate dehydrogenase (cytochrome)
MIGIMPEEFFSVRSGSVFLRVKAKPGARADSILGVRGSQLLVAVRALPEKGRANTEIARVLAKALGVSIVLAQSVHGSAGGSADSWKAGIRSLRCLSVEDPQLIAAAYARYLHDESSLRAGHPRRILFPSSLEDLSIAIRETSDQKGRVTISGARTGIVGGAVVAGGEDLLSMEKLVFPPRKSYSERFESWTVRVAPGMTLDALRESLEQMPGAHMFPVDPTEGSASLGGMVATNASGACTLLYGPTRAWVAGLTLVLADGGIVELSRGETTARNGEVMVRGRRLHLPFVQIPSTKHAVGYYAGPAIDAIDLFIGGEGTLAVVADVELLLTETPKIVCGVAAFLLAGQPVGSLVRDLKQDTIVVPRALEYMDSHSISVLEGLRVEVGPRSGLPELPADANGLLYVEYAAQDDKDAEQRLARINDILAAHLVPSERTWAATTRSELEEIRRMRHTLPERVNVLILRRRDEIPGLTKVAADCAVPEERLDEMMSEYGSVLEEAGLQRAVFGHIGNAHLHVNILPRSPDELVRAREAVATFARSAVTLGGSVSGEHGIGKLKKELLAVQYTQQELEGLRSLKSQLDPNGLLNPGVLW